MKKIYIKITIHRGIFTRKTTDTFYEIVEVKKDV